jgi:hypothetical protein
VYASLPRQRRSPRINSDIGDRGVYGHPAASQPALIVFYADGGRGLVRVEKVDRRDGMPVAT